MKPLICLCSLFFLYSCMPQSCEEIVTVVCEADNSTTSFITTKKNYSRTISSSKRTSTCKTKTVNKDEQCSNRW